MNLRELSKSFSTEADPFKAEQMQAYMKDRFSFYGLSAPERRRVQKPFLDKLKKEKVLQLDMVRELWAMEEREYQMLAVDYLMAKKRLCTPDHIDSIEECITTKSWWDSVDMLAGTVVGGMVFRHPELLATMDKWNIGNNMWLNRSSIIYQLKYKENTDFERLCRYIRRHAASKEFFLQKAAGWALREHSKRQPDEVADFIDGHDLRPLTVREAAKYL